MVAALTPPATSDNKSAETHPIPVFVSALFGIRVGTIDVAATPLNNGPAAAVAVKLVVNVGVVNTGLVDNTTEPVPVEVVTPVPPEVTGKEEILVAIVTVPLAKFVNVVLAVPVTAPDKVTVITGSGLLVVFVQS